MEPDPRGGDVLYEIQEVKKSNSPIISEGGGVETVGQQQHML